MPLPSINLASGLFGGQVAGGSMAPSAVNDGAGGRSQVAGLVAWVAVILTLLFLTPLFTNLPETILAALILHALWHIVAVAQAAHRPAGVAPGIRAGAADVCRRDLYRCAARHARRSGECAAARPLSFQPRRICHVWGKFRMMQEHTRILSAILRICPCLAYSSCALTHRCIMPMR